MVGEREENKQTKTRLYSIKGVNIVIKMSSLMLETLSLTESNDNATAKEVEVITTVAKQSDAEVIALIEKFLTKGKTSDTYEKAVFERKPRLSGICALTVAVDRTSLVGTFIFDYDKKQMHKHYPGRYSSNCPTYEKIGDIRWTINLATGLKPCDGDGKATKIPENIAKFPFCCDQCTLLYRKRLTNDRVFDGFRQSKGSSEYTFRVVKKIQHGDLLWMKHFILKDGTITEIEYPESEYKVNSFKIYTCDRHNTYYSVNLQTEKNQCNYHHAKGQNETEYGPKLLSRMSQAAYKIL